MLGLSVRELSVDWAAARSTSYQGVLEAPAKRQMMPLSVD